MKKIVAIVLSMLISFAVLADPAKNVILSYNSKTGEISITANHKVKDPKDHYIDRIEIYVDGVQVKKLTYTQQTDAEKHHVVVKLENVKIGSEIKVTTNCNKSGKKSATITATETK